MRMSVPAGCQQQGAALGLRIVRERMSAVYRCLNSSDSKLAVAALHLLTSANAIESACSAELADTFSFDAKAIRRALKSGREAKGSSDRRGSNRAGSTTFKAALLRFGISFIEHGSASTREKVAQIKDFLDVLLADLHLDRPDIVKHVVEVIHSRMVLDKSSVSRTAKIRFFTAKMLGSVGKKGASE